MIYEFLIEHLAATILETRLLSEGGKRGGNRGVVTAVGPKLSPSKRDLQRLNPSNPVVHPGIQTVLVVRGGKVVRVPKTDVKPDDILAEAYLSKYSYRTPRETMASRVTIDPKTGEEKSARTFTAKIDAQADLTKLEMVKGRVRETGKPHEITFIGKKGPQLQPHKHREVEHKLEVRMHVGEPHVFYKGEKVQLRATGNGVHIVAPGEKSDRIIAHSGMLSSPHFGGVVTSAGRRQGREIEQRTAKMAEKRKRTARKAAKKRKATSTIRQKAAAVAGKAKKLTPVAPAAPSVPEAGKSEIGEFRSRIADIMKRLNKG